MIPTVFMFSGQGSQYFQMGRGLYESDPVFAREMREMDAIARANTGRSVLDELYGTRSKADEMADIALSHPAIFMVEVALARSVMYAGVRADLVLGASLGTVAAAVVAGQLDRDDGLMLVLAQARCIAQHAPPGGMMAILDAPQVIERELAEGAAVIAGRNFNGHFVASAPVAALDRIELRLRERAIVHQRLPVPYAFHSPWIDPMRDAFIAATRGLPSRPSTVGVVCCASMQTLHTMPPDHFWQVARLPVEFQRTVQALESRGPHRYIDLGPSGTLATFIKYLLGPGARSTAQPVIAPFGRDEDRFAALL